MSTEKPQNPFAITRAEHLGQDLHLYFAGANLLGNLLSAKSLVLVGGRGSGKTMYFMYHSYDSKKREHFDPALGQSRILEKEAVLGIYFKAEPDLVPGFQKKGHDDDWWLSVFGHYFNVTICRAMCHIAGELKRSGLAALEDETSICISALKSLTGEHRDQVTFAELGARLREAQDDLLLFINNIDTLRPPVLSHHSNAMRRLAERLVASIGIENLAFHVFIDEFENLLLYQQRLINSLIKNPHWCLVFDIGIRQRGFRTYETLADNERISEFNDYVLFNLENQISEAAYDSLINEICRKRLRAVPALRDRADADQLLQIEHYLGTYDVDEELRAMTSGVKTPPYLHALEAKLATVSDPTERARLRKVLLRPDDPLITRLNLVLLTRGKSACVVAEELEKFEQRRPSKYDDWLHNYRFAVVFLLCGEYRQRKKYFGYETYLQLSSGIARYFIEMCFYAFDFAQRRGDYVFGRDGRLTVQIQDMAAQHVSRIKVDEIDTYPPVGHTLQRLALLLGRVFERLHRNPRLSEPEQNHFYTSYEEASSSVREVLDSGLMWAVFQARPLTKIKQSAQPRGTEYHLNHIYAPHFQISYRRKRRLDIGSREFDRLVNGTEDEALKVVRKLIKGVRLDGMADFLRSEDAVAQQMELWGSDADQPDV